MRGPLTVAALHLLALTGATLGHSQQTISQIPPGTVSEAAYSNPGFGITWLIPAGWTAKIDPTYVEELDPDHPDGRARKCSRVLVWLRAPQISEDRFASMAALIAIDPHCLSHAQFPRSVLDKERIDDVVDAILKNFKRSPFFSPYGVKTIAFPSTDGGRSGIDILMSGTMTINAESGHPAATKVPLDVNTLFSVTEYGSYWLAAAYVADGPSTDELKQVGPILMNAASK
jgi:hypothetical protein